MEGYISIKQVLDDILEHPMLRDLKFERAVKYTVDFIRIVGCPRIFHERTQILHIKDYRAALPCDYESIIQVRTHGESNHKHEVFRHTTDSFHMSEDKHSSYDLTYKIQGGVIFTSMRDGDIEIAYNAFPIDEDGYPAIIDNSSFTRALEFYIKKKCFTVLFDQGKITPAVYNQVLQDYAWAVGQAQSDLVRPTIDQMQALTNSLNTLVPRVNEHSSGFVNNGSMEKIKIITMARAINDDVTIKGSTLVIGVKFPPVDDKYSFNTLLNAGNIKVEYYIINTDKKYKVENLYRVLSTDDKDYNNMYAFTVDTTNLTYGVLMVQCTATIPAHDSLPERIEIARCSTGIAVVE